MYYEPEYVHNQMSNLSCADHLGQIDSGGIPVITCYSSTCISLVYSINCITNEPLDKKHLTSKMLTTMIIFAT